MLIKVETLGNILFREECPAAVFYTILNINARVAIDLDDKGVLPDKAGGIQFQLSGQLYNSTLIIKLSNLPQKPNKIIK